MTSAQFSPAGLTAAPPRPASQPVEPTPTSQEGRILASLRAGARLTPMAALQLIGCMSLAQRVSILRRRYLQPIRRQMVRRGKKRVAEYRLDHGRA